jgi:hypothetical protein
LVPEPNILYSGAVDFRIDVRFDLVVIVAFLPSLSLLYNPFLDLDDLSD